MSIIEYTGPSNPQDIRKYLMRRTKEEIVHEYLRQWRYSGEVEAERDAAVEREQALAAHAERMSKAALDAIHYLPGGDIKAELRDAYDETPESSLARQKPLWQAEVLEEAGRFVRCEEDAALLRINAAELRRQAEGGDHAD